MRKKTIAGMLFLSMIMFIMITAYADKEPEKQSGKSSVQAFISSVKAEAEEALDDSESKKDEVDTEKAAEDKAQEEESSEDEDVKADAAEKDSEDEEAKAEAAEKDAEEKDGEGKAEAAEKDAGDEEAKADAAEGDLEDADEKKGIYILYTSDVHCGVSQGFGFAGLYAIRNNLEERGYDTILVDDGDCVQGEAIGTLTNGEALLKLMNAVGYDVAIPGNHEFDYGVEQFIKLKDMAEFPYISCNFNKGGELLLPPYQIVEAAGKKIGFVGVTTPETMNTSAPMREKNEDGEYVYDFLQNEDGSDVYEAVQKAVDDCRAEGADYVYVMGHMGLEEAVKPYTYADVISHTNGIDVFLDGHSHDTVQVVMKNKDGENVIRSAVGTKMSCIGYSLITDRGIEETDVWSWPNSIDAPAFLNIQNEVSEAIEETEKEFEKTLGEVLAHSDVNLFIYDPVLNDTSGNSIRIVRRTETNIGDLCSDAFRVMTGADIGVINGGGIRDGISRGDVTKGDLLGVFPWDNNVCVVKASGQQILDALEWGARGIPEENGAFLDVSGITYQVDLTVDSGCTANENGMMTGITRQRRVKNVMFGNEPLDPEKIYTVAGLDYTLLDNGDGQTGFDGAEVEIEDAGIEKKVLIDYIIEKLGGNIGEEYEDPYGQGRIEISETAIEESAETAAMKAGSVKEDDSEEKAAEIGSDEEKTEEEAEQKESKAFDEESEAESKDAKASEKESVEESKDAEASEEESEKESASESESEESASLAADLKKLAEIGVRPVTWEPSPDHLIIEGDEAREMYTRIKAGDYPTMEEIVESPLLDQIDALSAYYIDYYGKTSEIDTAARRMLRNYILDDFLSIGSARTESINEETQLHKYVYDGPLEKGYEMELVLGLPASGKSSRVTDPDSEEMKAFILDCDVIKEMLPEFQESHGGAADAVHMESMMLMERAMEAFTEGDLKGTNVILPLVADDYDSLMETYIKPFEEAGYNVRAKFVPCELNVSAARNLARELETGRIINSAVVSSFGTKPEEVYKKLAKEENAKGLPYGVEVESIAESASGEQAETEQKEAA